MGTLFKGSRKAIRDKKHKHYVSVEEYKEEEFPPVIWGAAILYTQKSLLEITPK